MAILLCNCNTEVKCKDDEIAVCENCGNEVDRFQNKVVRW